MEVIRKTQEKGNKVFLCTGRNREMARPLLELGFDGLVCSAGGYVEMDGEVLFDHPMTREQLDACLDVLHKNQVFCTIEGKVDSFADGDMGEFMDDVPEWARNSELERWRKTLAGQFGFKPMEEYDGQPIYKVVVVANRMEQFDEPKQKVGDQFHFAMQTLSGYGCVNGELINRAFDKGRGVERVCGRLGIPVSDSIGFGDSMNDVEMIQKVGTSVCMDNGSPELKAMSDMVCPAVEQDGLAKAFKELGLV